MFKWFKKHTDDGREVPDPTPISVPLIEKPLTLAQQIARFTTSEEVALLARRRGIDTFDEANDFGAPVSDPLDKSPYEVGEMEEDDLGIQSRMDEVKHGVVEDMPQDRLERAKDRLRGPKKPPEDDSAASGVKKTS